MVKNNGVKWKTQQDDALVFGKNAFFSPTNEELFDTRPICKENSSNLSTCVVYVPYNGVSSNVRTTVFLELFS